MCIDEIMDINCVFVWVKRNYYWLYNCVVVKVLDSVNSWGFVVIVIWRDGVLKMVIFGFG